ncbi:MAG TPA: Xaa-Pro peptidase family protein [Candidatus Barnesiella excrementigallinarum]|nr:Xaa-Pro peptidase family protein [Candidatus Barnesiella excrementigallinarum]
MYSSSFRPEALLRCEKIQSALRTSHADSILLNTNANLYYASGRVFSGYVYVPAEGEPHYFVRRPVGLKGDTVHYIHKPEQIPALLAEAGLPIPRCVALEWDASHGDFTRLAAVFPDVEVVNGSAVMRAVRSVKTNYELALMQESAVKHAEVYRRIESVFREGMTDIELQIEIERLLRLHGNLGLFRINGQSMEIFMGNVICGDNADSPTPYDFAMGGAGLSCSIPVGANGSLIRPGMTVMVDMCGNFTGYMTDMTRVYSVGELSAEAARAHACSIEIHRAVARMGRPGVAAADLYRLAVQIAQDAGLDDYFMGHTQKAGFVGHGVGIEVNEAPVLAPRSKELLVENQVIALEPKFVIPHVGAVGIEDTYVVTPEGMKAITSAPIEILPLQ